jgi:hypothetical protein
MVSYHVEVFSRNWIDFTRNSQPKQRRCAHLTAKALHRDGGHRSVGDDQRASAVQLQAHVLHPFLAVAVLVLTAALPLAVEYVVD